MGMSIGNRINFIKWLYPGMKVKRWVLLIFAGLLLMSAGLAMLINGRQGSFLGLIEEFIKNLGQVSTGRILPPAVNGIFLGLLGLLACVAGTMQVFRSVFSAIQPMQKGELVEKLYRRRQLEHGIRIVAFGGGTGLSSLLRGIKEFTSNITAVVTVADDGGSSGILRRETGMTPPGDIRNCLVALADSEPLMTKLFQHRFNGITGLEGHAFGNLLLAALTDVTGDFEQAVKEASRVLAIRGQVFPATLEDVVLWAEMRDGSLISGESSISAGKSGIRRIYLKPDTCSPYPEILDTIREADAIVIGPGSLYTSVIPPLLVNGIADTIRASEAIKIYVCNVMTQAGETGGYMAADHLRALIDHVGPLVDYMLVNSARPTDEALQKYSEEGAELVRYSPEDVLRLGVQPMMRPLINRSILVRHNPRKLGEAIYSLIEAAI